MKKVLLWVGLGLFILGLIFLNVYRSFWQPCDSMAGWSTNVPMRCVKGN